MSGRDPQETGACTCCGVRPGVTNYGGEWACCHCKQAMRDMKAEEHRKERREARCT